VSRGLGSLQRGICESLAAAKGYELPLRELRRRLGEPDRSNLRRAIRGLLERSLVEESHSGSSSGAGGGWRSPLRAFSGCDHHRRPYILSTARA